MAAELLYQSFLALSHLTAVLVQLIVFSSPLVLAALGGTGLGRIAINERPRPRMAAVRRLVHNELEVAGFVTFATGCLTMTATLAADTLLLGAYALDAAYVNSQLGAQFTQTLGQPLLMSLALVIVGYVVFRTAFFRYNDPTVDSLVLRFAQRITGLLPRVDIDFEARL